MKRLIRILAATILSTSLLLPLASAQTGIYTGVVISEVQTEGLIATDDFIELSNTGLDSVDLTGWELQTKATGATSTWIKRATLSGLIYPDGSIIISYSDGVNPYLADIAAFHFLTGLSTTGGHVRLFDTINALEIDKVGWGTAADAETLAAPKAESPNSLNRLLVDGKYQDTDNNFNDFEVAVPTPRADNTPDTLPPDPPIDDPTDPPVDPVLDPPVDETVDPPVEDDTETSVAPILPDLPLHINELLIDPVSPQTDANDEWIELYNPNDEAVELRDYKLYTGSKYSYLYIFVDEVILGNGFLSVGSANTSLVLNNSGGAVRLSDPFGDVMDEVTYDDSEAGQAYAWDAFAWIWTTSPTRDAENLITLPPVKVKAVKKSSTRAKKKRTKKTVVKSSKAKQVAQRDIFEDPAIIDADPPIHPGVLAGGGGLALIYGGYEYREDFRNKVIKFRRYLEARRKHRSKIKRW